jgi:hypothetical protein
LAATLSRALVFRDRAQAVASSASHHLLHHFVSIIYFRIWNSLHASDRNARVQFSNIRTCNSPIQ